MASRWKVKDAVVNPMGNGYSFPMPGEGSAKVFTVSEITFLVRDLLEEGFRRITVEGEVSNFRPSSTGHYYFSLKDREAILAAVMFRNRLENLTFVPADGMRIRATGNLSVYARRGTYQLVCESLVRAGVGDILAMLEERKKRLAALGLFEAARKKPLPLFPSRVAVVTSPTGAALRDILRVLKRRNAGIDLVILPTPVQGEGAAETIAARIRTANRYNLADVLIVGRGGGSLEDLLAFSEEEVVLAIADSAIPVISAVGHETDFTLSDLVADVRAPTPSAAAEIVSASRTEIARRIRDLQESLASEMERRLERVQLLRDRFSPANLEHIFNSLSRPLLLNLDAAREALAAAMRERLARERSALTLYGELLLSRSPLAILERGYAVVIHKASGRTVLSSAQVEIGDDLRIALHRGSLEAVTKEKS